MKIQIVSDLHLEFGHIRLPRNDRDLLILAGDIHVGKNAREFIEKQLTLSPVIYIMGNHEFYQHKYEEILRYWKNLSREGLYFLHDQEAIIPGFENIRFLGATLWTDFSNGNPKWLEYVQGQMSDFDVIQYYDHILTPKDTVHFFTNSLKWLTKKLSEPKWQLSPNNSESERKTVVVTHHMPSFKSVAWKYQGNPLNYAFTSDLDSFIEESQPNLWIHGHTHDSFDYMMGQTRILCNPRGYCTFEENKKFKPDLMIEL